MKLNQLEIDILAILSKKELDRIEILKELKTRNGREPSLSSFYPAMTKLKTLELISGRWDRSPGLFGGNIEFYSTSDTGYRVIKPSKDAR